MSEPAMTNKSVLVLGEDGLVDAGVEAECDEEAGLDACA
jgi:hypothetical protein